MMPLAHWGLGRYDESNKAAKKAEQSGGDKSNPKL